MFSIKKWVEELGAIGIVSKSGRYVYRQQLREYVDNRRVGAMVLTVILLVVEFQYQHRQKFKKENFHIVWALKKRRELGCTKRKK